jgi:glycosyltransferase involved in cell wall biosynthesis
MLCEQLNLRSEVIFTGGLAQERVRQLLSEATIMALACVPDRDGNMDALPTVLLEALALNIPIASTKLTGIPEIVGDEAGILVPPGDDAAMADAIRTLWDRIRGGAQPPGTSRARASRLFDLRTNVAKLRERFTASASGSRPA